jgi:hypothetical protein
MSFTATPTKERPILVLVLPGSGIVALPNGTAGNPGDTIALTPHEFDQIDPDVFGVVLEVIDTGSELAGATLTHQTGAFALIIGPVAPSAPFVRTIVAGPTSTTFTNTTSRPLVLTAHSILRSNMFPEGSCFPDLKCQLQLDGGGYNDINQRIIGLSGTIGDDPAFGGDGTVLPFGINGYQSADEATLVDISNGLFMGLPILDPGESIDIDVQLDFGYVGAWNASIMVFNLGILTIVGTPA